MAMLSFSPKSATPCPKCGASMLRAEEAGNKPTSLRMHDVRSRRDIQRSLQVSFRQAGPPQLAASSDTMLLPVAPKVSTSIQNAAYQ
jgi:hypothetical protein